MDVNDVKVSLDRVRPTEFQKQVMFDRAVNGGRKRRVVRRSSFVLLPFCVVLLVLSQGQPSEMEHSSADAVVEIVREDTFSYDLALFDRVSGGEFFEVNGALYVEVEQVIDEALVGAYLFTLRSSNSVLDGALVYDYEGDFVFVKVGDKDALFVTH